MCLRWCNGLPSHHFRCSMLVLSPFVFRPDRFSYDGVLGGDVSQQQVYDECVGPLIPSVLTGVNATVLAYGQVCTSNGT